MAKRSLASKWGKVAGTVVEIDVRGFVDAVMAYSPISKKELKEWWDNEADFKVHSKPTFNPVASFYLWAMEHEEKSLEATIGKYVHLRHDDASAGFLEREDGALVYVDTILAYIPTAPFTPQPWDNERLGSILVSVAKGLSQTTDMRALLTSFLPAVQKAALMLIPCSPYGPFGKEKNYLNQNSTTGAVFMPNTFDDFMFRLVNAHKDGMAIFEDNYREMMAG